MDDYTSDVQAAVEAVQRLHKPADIPDIEAGAIILPDGMSLHSLEQIAEARRLQPRRRKGRATAQTLESFIAMAQRFGDDDSAVFCDLDDPTLIAVHNYHNGSPIEEGNFPTPGQTSYNDHRAVYRFPLSEAWRAWTALPESITQSALAELLDERLEDVGDPTAIPEGSRKAAKALGIKLATPAQLIDLSRRLAINVDSRVVNSQNLSTGEGEIVYSEEHRDDNGAPVKVPGGFVLVIPVFERGPLYPILVRLRYRVRSGSISWRLLMHRTDRALEDAINESVEAVRAATERPVYFGTPER